MVAGIGWQATAGGPAVVCHPMPFIVSPDDVMKRERNYKTEAIVMRRTDFGEADRLLTLYTRDYGKLKAIAKGARKPKSRKTGHVGLFMRSQFMIAVGRSLDIVTSAETIESHQALATDLLKTTYAAYAIELLDNLTPEEERHVGIYQLVADTLARIADSDNLMLIARHYELRLLSLVGFQPQLFYNVATGEPIEERDYLFSAEEGGLIELSQRSIDRKARRTSAASIKVLRFLQTRDWRTVEHLQLRGELHRELESIMHFYVAHLLERGLKSTDFLLRLRREASLHVSPFSGDKKA